MWEEEEDGGGGEEWIPLSSRWGGMYDGSVVVRNGIFILAVLYTGTGACHS